MVLPDTRHGECRQVDGRLSTRSQYDSFLLDTEYPWCWYCGRELEDAPESWYGPWLIERCHIASSPRIRDRRLAVLQCSRCHLAQHGQLFDQSLAIKPPSLSTMLWLKATFDPEFYSRSFVQRFHVSKLPAKQMPSASVQTVYLNRRGPYP